MQTVTLEGYGSDKGLTERVRLIGVEGNHIKVEIEDPLNKESPETIRFRVVDGMAVGSTPEGGFQIPSAELQRLTAPVETPANTKGNGIKLKTKIAVKGGSPVNASSSKNGKTAAVQAPPVKRGPGRPPKSEVSETPTPVRTGGPGRPSAVPPPTSKEIQLNIPEGLYNELLESYKPKKATEERKALHLALKAAIAVKGYTVNLSKANCTELVSVMESLEPEWEGVRGGAIRRGAKRIAAEINDRFRIKVPASLKSDEKPAAPKAKGKPAPVEDEEDEEEEEEEIPVKRGPGRPPKVQAPPVRGKVRVGSKK